MNVSFHLINVVLFLNSLPRDCKVQDAKAERFVGPVLEIRNLVVNVVKSDARLQHSVKFNASLPTNAASSQLFPADASHMSQRKMQVENTTSLRKIAGVFLRKDDSGRQTVARFCGKHTTALDFLIQGEHRSSHPGRLPARGRNSCSACICFP